MTVSSQIIEVVNDLCAKFGIAIDWTSENVSPVIQELAGKLVRWEIATSIVWLIIVAVLVIADLSVLYTGIKKKWDEDFMIPFTLISMFVIPISCVAFCAQIFDIVEANIFPEKMVFEYVKMMLKGA